MFNLIQFSFKLSEGLDVQAVVICASEGACLRLYHSIKVRGRFCEVVLIVLVRHIQIVICCWLEAFIDRRTADN